MQAAVFHVEAWPFFAHPLALLPPAQRRLELQRRERHQRVRRQLLGEAASE